METAKFVDIRMTKSGKITGSIRFDSGKTMPVPAGVKLSLDLNNKECVVTRENGMIIQIVCDGKELMNKAKNLSTNQVSNHPTVVLKMQQEYRPGDRVNTGNTSDRSAKAPYNFIPLNQTLVEGEETVNFSAYHEGRLAGYIQCELEALTPLYIRDTLDEDEVVNNLESNKHPDFFSPGGRCRIPGSSLRGMVRNLVEIMGWGKMLCDGERKLFFRAVGDISSLGEYYRNVMLNQSDGCFPKINAGVLRRNAAGEYEILPSKTIQNTQIYRVNYDNHSRRINGTNIYLKQFDFREIYFEPVMPDFHRHQRLVLKYAKLENISETPREGYVKGYIVSSGDFGDKKHMHWIINTPATDASPILIDRKIVDDYNNDSSRNENSNLFAMLIKHSEGVPCFYITDNSGNICSFGFTGMFRLGYSKSIGEHIPEQLKDKNKIDISETVFGKAGDFASRVFFEDAKLSNDPHDIYMQKQVPQILSSPKPTTFQHYLKQAENADLKNLNHWNSSCNIRGHKLYWHRRNFEWTEDKPVGDNDNQHTIIKPVKVGTQFVCKIRFENLTETELGALLFALDLPENYYHKLGMGKPLGLGTIKIIPTLYLSDRKKRYSRLFDGNRWQLAEEVSEVIRYKASFEHYVLNRMSLEERNGADSLWAVERMKHLKAMLDGEATDKSDWWEETRYMQIEHPQNENEFKKRPILADPVEIKKRFQNRPKN
jgi:CRISPR-associated protein (TIGR03986 family)